MSDPEDLKTSLARWMDTEISDLRRLSGGASRETWAFTASGRRLVLQRDREGAERTGGGIEAEAALLPLVAEAGVAVPELIASDVDGQHTGAPGIVSSHVDGETIARRILRDDRFAAARDRFTQDAAVALAGIHRVDVDSVPGLVEQDQLAQFREIFDVFDEPHPAFELAFRWLERFRPALGRRALVHGDFRLGNLMVDETGIVAVLDWELAHVGDPMEDLGWLCVRAWRFGDEAPVAGIGQREDLYASYTEATGETVDPATVRWWEVLGTLKWGIMCMIQASSHLLGHVRSVELAAIGRRVCENEHDVLSLMSDQRTASDAEDPAVPPAPSSSSPAGAGVHGRPTAQELVEATREFLERDVMEDVQGRVGFHTRVAVNALKIVERELADGGATEAANATRLADLGFADDRALSAAIRDGGLDEHWDDVTEAVAATVRDKLAVANPRHLG